jgi:hypothetical protein
LIVQINNKAHSSEDEREQRFTVYLSDILGNSLTEADGIGRTMLNLSGYNKGVYFLKISIAASVIINEKIVLQ